jgi:hypothetical protein
MLSEGLGNGSGCEGNKLPNFPDRECCYSAIKRGWMREIVSTPSRYSPDLHLVTCISAPASSRSVASVASGANSKADADAAETDVDTPAGAAVIATLVVTAALTACFCGA